MSRETQAAQAIITDLAAQVEKQKTIQYLTDLMGVIQNAYYKRGLFMPLEYDSHSRVRGDLRVHEVDGADTEICIDLYHFEGDGKPVCDGLKPCTVTFDDGTQDTGWLFCMHYCPEEPTPLLFVFSPEDERWDIDVGPECVPAGVLENIVRWIESMFNDNDNESK